MIIWMTNANFQIMEERLVIQSTPFKLSKKFLLILRNQEFPEISQNSKYFQRILQNSQAMRGGHYKWSLLGNPARTIFPVFL